LQVFAASRSAGAWLESFDAGQAHAGRQQQFSGGRVSVRTHELPGLRGHDLDPSRLLAIAAQAVEPIEEPKPRPLKVAAVSSR
jgi:hypothetical protein